MIDWLNLALNSLWITALALALAAVSYARWDANVRGERWLERLRAPSYQVVFDVAGVLFCTSLTALSPSWLEKLIWIVLGAVFLGQGFFSGRSIARQRSE